MQTFGRGEEQAQLVQASTAGTRCLVLHGPAGVGKSHLAQAFLGAHPATPHKVVPADGFRSVSALDATLAATLELPPARSPQQTDRLTHALRSLGDFWLLLDGAESIDDNVGAQLETYLQAAPNLRALLTSRRRLALPSATTFELAPLQLPAEDDTDDEQAPALQMLLQRARRFRRAYHPKADDGPALRRILQLLDGLPLAIEVAAPRLVLLGANRLAERLETHPDALGKGDALRTAIASSWQLLDADAQHALSLCALFRGGFDIDAVEHLLSTSKHAVESDTIDLLQSLYEHSLLRAMDDGRFEMYGRVRDFVENQAPAPTNAQQHFAAYYADLGQKAAEGLRGSTPKTSWALLQQEQTNLHRAAQVGAPTDRLRAAIALAPLALAQGPFQAFADLIASAEGDLPADHPLVVDARIVRAEALAIAGLSEEATACLPLSPADPNALAEAHRVRAKIALTRGELEEAVRLADEGLAQSLSRTGPLRMVRAAALGPLGRLDDCRESLEGALTEFRALGELREEGIALAYLGNVFADLDRMQDARFCLAQAHAIHEEIGDRFGMAFSEANVGLLHHKEGAPAEALLHYERAIPAFARLGARWYETGFQGYRAMAMHQAGHADQDVLDAFRTCLDALDEGDRFYGYFTAYLASVTADSGAFSRARSLLEEAEAHIEGSGDPVFRIVLDWHRAHVLAAEGATGPEGTANKAGSDKTRLEALRAPALASVLVDVCAARHGRHHATPVALARGVHIENDGSSFRIADGRIVDLTERMMLRRLLAKLVSERDTAPGKPLDAEALVSAAWPGERILPKAARNRLRVAIATLRKLGLQEAIRTQRSGYYLDPHA